MDTDTSDVPCGTGIRGTGLSGVDYGPPESVVVLPYSGRRRTLTVEYESRFTSSPEAGKGGRVVTGEPGSVQNSDTEKTTLYKIGTVTTFVPSQPLHLRADTPTTGGVPPQWGAPWGGVLTLGFSGLSFTGVPRKSVWVTKMTTSLSPGLFP